MNATLLERLSRITPEEQVGLAEQPLSPQVLYGKSGRFIIERRHMSHRSTGQVTAPILMHPHPRFREFPLHSHDYIELMYVCSGRITHVIDDKEICLEADDLILFGKDTRHAIRPAGKEDIGMNWIISTDLLESELHGLRRNSRFSCRVPEELIRSGGLPYYVLHGRDSLAIRNLMEAMIDSYLDETYKDGYILQQSLALLLSYLAAQTEAWDNTDAAGGRELLQKKLREYIRTSYSTATLTEAAQMLGLSPSYLSRLTCQLFGVSFKELLLRERFFAAGELLGTTKMPIGDIINHIGYENSSYFHKEFKKRYGVTPKEYRRTHEF